jgi:hypothetical protein
MVLLVAVCPQLRHIEQIMRGGITSSETKTGRGRKTSPSPSSFISLPDLDAAKLWMVNEHLGRRNFTDEQRAYWIGKQYEWEKQAPHRPEGKGGQNDHLNGKKDSAKSDHAKTRKKVAKQHHVDESTIRRDAKFARAVDIIACAVGDAAKDAILRGEVKIGRQEVQKLAEIATAGLQSCGARLPRAVAQPLPLRR